MFYKIFLHETFVWFLLKKFNKIKQIIVFKPGARRPQGALGFL